MFPSWMVVSDVFIREDGTQKPYRIIGSKPTHTVQPPWRAKHVEQYWAAHCNTNRTDSDTNSVAVSKSTAECSHKITIMSYFYSFFFLFQRKCGSNLLFDLAAVVSDSSASLRWKIYWLYIFISLCFIYCKCNITSAILQVQYYKYNITSTMLQVQYYKCNITSAIL